MVRYFHAMFILCAFSTQVHAACQGSSPERTAANNSQAEVVACINAAVDGDTINVPAGSGSVTWSGFTLPNTKGLTLKGPGKTNLTVTLTGSMTLNCSANRPHRLSGFRFVGSSAEVVVVGTCSGFRIDNNEFNNPSENYIQVNAGIYLSGPLYGVIDNNTVIASVNRRILLYSGGIEWGKRTNWSEGSHLGSANNIYIEDNTLNFSTQANPGLGAVDANSGAAFVFRYNYVRNASMKSHPVCSSEGTANQSAYGNTFVSDSGVTSGYRSIHNQGSGEAVIFNNTFTATGSKSGSVIDVLHYRSADPSAVGCGLYPRCDGSSQNAAWDGNRSPTSTYYGYRCRYQPGSKAGPNGTSLLSPIYAWNNKWSDTGGRVDVQVSDPWSGQVAIHVQKNRDIYEAGSVNAQTSSTSPFNGTTGVGFGLLQYRPTTCTTNANESGGGVGYFATDVGSQGTLYRCSATNTWTTHYTPYSYPHPIRNQGDDPIMLSAPTNLRVYQ